jgi:hypothetical protein
MRRLGADMLYWHDDFCRALVTRGFEVFRFDNRDSGESTHLDWAGAPNTRSVEDRFCAGPDVGTRILQLVGGGRRRAQLCRPLWGMAGPVRLRDSGIRFAVQLKRT